MNTPKNYGMFSAKQSLVQGSWFYYKKGTTEEVEVTAVTQDPGAEEWLYKDKVLLGEVESTPVRRGNNPNDIV